METNIMNFKRLLTISRPRFWIYVLGTFTLGVVAAGDPRLLNVETLILLGVLFIFFSFPANLLIYGVNDIFDYETDRHNPKKLEYEGLISPAEQPFLLRKIALLVLPFLIVMLFMNISSIVIFLVFIFTSIYYSARPIRAKARPPLDIIFSSIIYISPAIIGFFATGSFSISWLGVLGGILWTMAMQTYSAVPDIEADRKGGVKTLATVLGTKASLWFCFVAYALAAYVGYSLLGIIPLILGCVYLVMVFYTILKTEKVFWIYKKFPLINTIFGMVLFLLLLFQFLY